MNNSARNTQAVFASSNALRRSVADSNSRIDQLPASSSTRPLPLSTSPNASFTKPLDASNGQANISARIVATIVTCPSLDSTGTRELQTQPIMNAIKLHFWSSDSHSFSMSTLDSACDIKSPSLSESSSIDRPYASLANVHFVSTNFSPDKPAFRYAASNLSVTKQSVPWETIQKSDTFSKLTF